MDQQRNTIAGKSQSKVVLIIALLLSLLSFSGQAIYQSNKHHSVKTEQIVSINKFSRKSKITTVSPHENIVVATYSHHQKLGVLLAHARSIEISIKHINHEALTFPKPTGFFVFSNVTHTSDEDNFNSIRG
jgi:hypothetical protein